MTTRRLLTILILCASLFVSCNNDRNAASITNTSSTNTSTTTSISEVKPISFELDEVFEGKFASFQISKDWELGSTSMNTTADTSYFYLSETEGIPFVVYQYEIAEGIGTLSESDWDEVAKNAEGTRISDITLNNRKFIRIVSVNSEDGMKMLAYYTFERQVLQCLAIFYAEDVPNEEIYSDLLEKIASTFEVDDGALKTVPTE